MEEVEKVEGTVVKEEDRKELVAIKGEVVGVIQQAHSLVIVDQPTLTKGVEMGSIITKLLRRLEKTRKEKTKKLKEYIEDEITKPFKEVSIPLKEAKDTIDGKIHTYRRQRDEEIEREREEAERLAAEKGGEIETLPVPTQEKSVKSDYGTMTTKKRWTCEVVDFSAVHDKYKLFNKPEAMKDVNRGIRDIPGVRIFQREDISYR